MTENKRVLVCDFCSATSPEWRYTSAPFQMFVSGEKDEKPAIVTYNSDDQWAACSECKEIVEAGERERLAVRSLEHCPEYSRIRDAGPEERKAYLDLLLAFHGTFFMTKSEAKPLLPGDLEEYDDPK
jgi:hypothetical protein